VPKKSKVAPSPSPVVDSILGEIEAGAGSPQVAIPKAALADIVVHVPVMTPLDRIVETEWNTNVQSGEKFSELVEDIKVNGFSGAVDVVPFTGPDGHESYLVVSGEWRCKAARLLGLKEIPASRLSHAKFQDADFQRILSIRRNNIHGRHDPEKTRALIEHLAKKYPQSDELRRLLAFDKTAEWKRLVGDTRKSLKGQGATQAQLAQFDEKAKKARSLADLSAIVSHLFDTHKETVPWGYMAFSFGGKEHLYVAATAPTMQAVKRIVAHCGDRNLEINSVLGPALTELADRLAKGVEGPLPGDF